MFSSVYRMECKNKFEITAVFSERGEKFKLSKPININHFKRHVDKSKNACYKDHLLMKKSPEQN
ncbi:hypothetical protein M3Y97_00859900 [Aphelenchoides bicaudatus]|nr:hypothetical protein M3Y97_00859900 [Aphelenchoides bicaudatus]